MIPGRLKIQVAAGVRSMSREDSQTVTARRKAETSIATKAIDPLQTIRSVRAGLQRRNQNAGKASRTPAAMLQSSPKKIFLHTIGL
jgi:hypothetical protein